MTTKIILIVCGVLAGLVAGCTVDPHVPPEQQYFAPVPGTGTATLIGSEVPSALTHNQTAFIFSVDGKQVMAGKKAWNVPLVLAAGPRVIDVQMVRGDFVSRSYLELEAVAGASYILRFSSDVGLVGNNTYCDFWIVDAATSKPVTSRQRGSIEGGGR